MTEAHSASTQGKPRIGERMLSQGMVTVDQLQIALIEQRKHGLLLGQQLVRLNFVTEALVRDLLASQHAYDSIDLGQVIPDPEVLAMVPEAFARQYRLLPLEFSVDNRSVRVAMADVFDVIALDQLRQRLGQDVQLKPLLATDAQIEQAHDKFYGHALSLEEILHEIETGQLTPKASLEIAQGQQPVVRLVNAILIDAVKQVASDLHFEPERGFLRIRYRVDGVLWQIRSLHERYWPAMCVRLKIMAGLDIAEQRCPQDGRMHLLLCGREIDFRVSSQPTLHGENIVLRVLDREKSIIPLSQMGLRALQLERLHAMLEKPEGMIVLTGPTGSGKTTTLYSLLNHLNHEQVNIMTLEDPVEYPVMQLRQTSVNEANKVNFSDGIRAILRQDPDIILVGEVRDEATASMALRAAMTGHLVMTTLHTNSAPAAFTRLQDLGLKPQLIAGNVIAVIGQRLLRRLCIYCKQGVKPDAERLQWLAGWATNMGISVPDMLYEAVGCEHCRMTGYRGRLAVMEIFALCPALDALLPTAPSLAQLQELARVNGYHTLAEEGLCTVLTGDVSWQELKRVIDVSTLLNTAQLP
ncbi:GspE/PulE family protein [Methylophilus aquaticus]|uniref:GspE/PulE family protein n=1 Tax=Methylophilus aquaticus TaxID=1971610 RepID=A0ABT9JTS8_9PROT|nr:GspE/PulE family protein [Methylophilus aquaticus]MDP8567864.1 GspE/PulE family protein [Methylophilus aquaticus]